MLQFWTLENWKQKSLYFMFSAEVPLHSSCLLWQSRSPRELAHLLPSLNWEEGCSWGQHCIWGGPGCCPLCPFGPTMSVAMHVSSAVVCSLVEQTSPCLGSTWHSPKGQEVEDRWEGPSCQPGGAVPEPCDTGSQTVLSARVAPQRGLRHHLAFSYLVIATTSQGE